MIYYLTNEYKEKWSIFWREFLTILITILIVILGSAMMSSYNSFLIMLGSIIVIGALFASSIILLRIQYNIILKKYVHNFQVKFTQLIKPSLSLLTFSIILLLLFILLVAISSISNVLVFIMFIAGALAIGTLVNTFKYALIENCINSDFTYRGAFKTFKKLLPDAWKVALKVEVKVFLFVLLVIIINLIIGGILMAIAIGILYNTGSIIGFIALMLVRMLLSLATGFLLMTLPIQYVISQYFNKIAPLDSNSSNLRNNSNPSYVEAETSTANESVFDA